MAPTKKTTMVLICIVLSGGVMLRKCLFPMIREKTQLYLNKYINVPTITTDKIDAVIVPSEHGNKAGKPSKDVLYLRKKLRF